MPIAALTAVYDAALRYRDRRNREGHALLFMLCRLTGDDLSNLIVVCLLAHG